MIVLRKSKEEVEIYCYFRIRGRFFRNVIVLFREMSENYGREFGGWIYECNIFILVLVEYKKYKI